MLAAILIIPLAGCEAPQAEFQANLVYLKLQEEAARTELTPQQVQDVDELLEYLFGTPDAPRIPELESADFDGILDQDLLQMAAGPVSSDQQGQPQGLYREHCVHCHGITGDGAGPTAAFLNPYPRDYRRGIFKFKSTPGPSVPPTDDDLMSVLHNGIAGTSMPSFRLLEEGELDALLQYVKYLSIRGEVERALVFESIDQLDEGDQLVDLSLAEGSEDDQEEFIEQMEVVDYLVSIILRRWRTAEGKTTEVPAKPADWDLAESIRLGRELFYGNVANCAKCHGDTGLGDGQTTDYDEWTKEYFDPQNPETVEPFLAMGALPPRNILPRNLRTGVYRGGRRPVDLYWRIHDGIPGSPMPAAPTTLTSEEIWQLVDYVRSLPFESLSQPWHGEQDYARERL